MLHGQWQNRPSKSDEHKHHIHQRWSEGCTNGHQLYRELKEAGYTGSYELLRDYVRRLRKVGQPGAPVLAPRTVTSWLLSHPDSLDKTQWQHLKLILASCPELNILAGHVRSFAVMLTHRRGEQLPQWIAGVRRQPLPSLLTFANRLEQDFKAVTAGLTLPWSSGVVEGHVNRIKMLKRQMYGRPGLPLLRKRVLLA
ncbi:transposase [Streptomyces sp. URMC 123]|uniref:transposase n=1 Tax=Streptomyces sp. URMC 123 TaxID=3423403 RepID=UPI003F1BD3C2